MLKQLKYKINQKINTFALRRISEQKILYCEKCGKSMIVDSKTGRIYCPNCSKRLDFFEENTLNWKSPEFDGMPPVNSICVCFLRNLNKVERYDVIRYDKSFKYSQWRIVKWKIIDV
jgi:DNA-directed RNA polymerase subunit RPC12/RpoP